MPTKGNCNRAKFHKLTAMMDSPSRAEAIAAFGLALDELAKDQDARFSVEYSLGNPDAEEAAQEMARLRAELADAFESVARYESTTKQLEETIDRLHESMAEVDDHFQPLEPPKPVRPPNAPKPSPVQPLPVMPFDWGAGNDLTVDTPQPRLVHSGPFHWSVLGWWAYGFAAVLWMAMVCLPDLRNSYSSFFLPLLWIISGVPAFLYLRKVRDDYGWMGVAVKLCLTAEILLVVVLSLLLFDRFGYPQLTTRERIFGFVVSAGSLWFLYSERFFSWVLDERKRTQFVVFPGAVFILISVVAWVTATDTRAVKAAAPLQRFSRSPHVRKHHPAPKPTPPPDNPPRVLEYDFELPARNNSAPVLLETSYSPATDRPYLVAAAVETPASSESGPGGFLLFWIGMALFVCLKLVLNPVETVKQKQKRYKKALDEANVPLPQNETGNAGHASAKDLKKRGWA